jgi:predicted ribosomally synthesized peptide with nif11-like leader
MPVDQANAFRDYVAQNDDVQREIRSALMTESASVSEIAAKYGSTFTSEEAEQAWDAAQDNELSDFELDMVAGGFGGRHGNGS